MRLIAVLLAAVSLIIGGPAFAAEQADVLIRHATVIDVLAGKPVSGRAIALRGGDIIAEGPDSAVARRFTATRTIDATGRFVMPGLWDTHVHFGGGPALIEENKALLPLYVAHGITTVRDASGDLPDEVLSWRGQIASGALLGPTLYSSGPKIEGLKPVWKGTLEVGDKAQVDAALDRLQALRVDFVKITDSTLDPQLFLYALRQAKARGLRTSAHIPMALTVEQAVDAGLTSIEHLDYAFKAGSRDEAAISADFAAGRITRAEANDRLAASFDPQVAMAAYRRFAAKGVFVTPTLNGSRILAWLDTDTHKDDPYLAYIGPGLRKTYDWRIERAAQADATAIARRHAHFDEVAAVLPMLQKAGVTIIAGTDAGFLNSFNYPGIGLHDELSLFVREGLTPAETLRAATRAGPAFFGKLDRYGSIGAGKAADLLILDHNPLKDIAATRAINGVVLRGRYFDRDELDGLLKETADKVAAWNRQP